MYTANADRGGMLDSLFASEMNDPSPYDKFGQLWFTVKETNTTLRNLAYELRLGRQLGYDSEDHLNLLIDTLKRELAYNSKKGICDPAMLSIGKNDPLPIGTELNLGIQQATFNEPYQFYTDVTFGLTTAFMRMVHYSIGMSFEDWVKASKDGGANDFKRHHSLFSAAQRSDRSKFFRLNHLFMVDPLDYPPQKLLRRDDARNMLFGMTARARARHHKISFKYEKEDKWYKKFSWGAAETLGEISTHFLFLNSFDVQDAGQLYSLVTGSGFDDPRDQAAIAWGWNHLDYFYPSE